MNIYFRIEEAKNKFRAIFNEDPDKYRFAGAEYIGLVAEYGLYLGNLTESMKMFDLHLKIQEDFSKVGFHLDDDKTKDIILTAIR